MNMMTHDTAVGMLVGLAVGDALGAPIEFQPARDPSNYVTDFMSGGVHDVSVGEYTDDTAMALAMADAFINNDGEFNAQDIMTNFVSWWKHGAFQTRGECFDIGNTTRLALKGYQEDISYPYRGVVGQYAAGNGALMRLAPAVIVSARPERAVELAVAQTVLTHGHHECTKYSRILAQELWRGVPLVAYADEKHPTTISREKVMSGGYVKDTYKAAWWAYQTTDNFEDCIVKAVNRGHDSDTTGAVAGMIAGRNYGYSNIPSKYKEKLHDCDHIVSVAVELFNKRR